MLHIIVTGAPMYFPGQRLVVWEESSSPINLIEIRGGSRRLDPPYIRNPQSPALSPQPPTMLDVLYEDNHLLVVNKPAMLPTMGVAEDRPSLLSVAKEYLREKYNKPGNVYLGIVSRLDAPVTGVVLLARTSKAAGRMSAQFRDREVEKSYWAIVEGRIEPREGRLLDFVRKDERHRRMHIAGANTTGSQRAELTYRVLEEEWESGRGG